MADNSRNQEWLVEAVIPVRVHCIVKASNREAAQRKAQAGQGMDWWYDDQNVIIGGTAQIRSVALFDEANKLRVGSACKEVGR